MAEHDANAADGIASAWRTEAIHLAEQLLPVVPPKAIDAHLFALMGLAETAAARIRNERQRKQAAAAARKATRRLTLVRPAQLDLFAEPAPSRILGRVTQDDVHVGA